MTRQKILDETNKLMDRCYTKGSHDLMVFQRQKFLNELLPLLDRLGVVIRVAKLEPSVLLWKGEVIPNSFLRDAGYVAVESLIKEKHD